MKIKDFKENPEKVEFLIRAIAKLIDFAIVFILSILFYPVGTLLSVVYISVSDFLQKGQSLGKKVVGFRVVVVDKNKACTLKRSIVRNLFLSIPILLTIIPILGWIMAPLLGFILVCFEIRFMFRGQSNRRLGDEMAGTKVVTNAYFLQNVQRQESSKWF